MAKEYDILRMKQDLIEYKVAQLIREMEEVKQCNHILQVLFSIILAILLAIGAAAIF